MAQTNLFGGISRCDKRDDAVMTQGKSRPVDPELSLISLKHDMIRRLRSPSVLRVQICYAECQEKKPGFMYFGTQFGKQVWRILPSSWSSRKSMSSMQFGAGKSERDMYSVVNVRAWLRLIWPLFPCLATVLVLREPWRDVRLLRMHQGVPGRRQHGPRDLRWVGEVDEGDFFPTATAWRIVPHESLAFCAWLFLRCIRCYVSTCRWTTHPSPVGEIA